MTWTSDRESSMKLWIRQLVTLSLMYYKAARWTRMVNFWFNFWSVFSAVYAIPAYGCGLVTGSVCVVLQWSGIVIGLVASTLNGIAFTYDAKERSREYQDSYQRLLKLTRTITLELQKPVEERGNASDFALHVVGLYDDVADKLPLPWFINGETQLANISLLRSYENDSGVHTTSTEENVLPQNNAVQKKPRLTIPLNDADRAVMNRIQMELHRLDRVDISALSDELYSAL